MPKHVDHLHSSRVGSRGKNMGAFVTKCLRSSHAVVVFPTNSRIFSHAHFSHAIVMAGASLAFLAGMPNAAHAVPLNLFGESRSAPQAAPAPAVNSRRPAPVRTATTAFDKGHADTKAKTTATLQELAAKGSGPLRIIVSLDRQQLTLYSGDQVIAHSRVSSGQRGHSTPTGVFSIIQKDRWHRSNIYDDAPMYFMQRITWSGVAMHQGIVPNYPASLLAASGCRRHSRSSYGPPRKTGARVIVSPYPEVSRRSRSHTPSCSRRSRRSRSASR